MTDRSDDKPQGLRRRLFVLRLAALGSLGALPGARAPEAAPVSPAPSDAAQGSLRPVASDSDPYDPPGRGRGSYGRGGISDSDPYDAPGRGRGNHGRGGISDSDPYDAPGRGRGGYRPPSTGRSDSDPYDAPGRGRGSYGRSGVSDSDPYDAPGRGRRGW